MIPRDFVTEWRRQAPWIAADMMPLLRPGLAWSAIEAGRAVSDRLIARLG